MYFLYLKLNSRTGSFSEKYFTYQYSCCVTIYYKSDVDLHNASLIESDEYPISLLN